MSLADAIGHACQGHALVRSPCPGHSFAQAVQYLNRAKTRKLFLLKMCCSMNIVWASTKRCVVTRCWFDHVRPSDTANLVRPWLIRASQPSRQDCHNIDAINCNHLSTTRDCQLQLGPRGYLCVWSVAARLEVCWSINRSLLFPRTTENGSCGHLLWSRESDSANSAKGNVTLCHCNLLEPFRCFVHIHSIVKCLFGKPRGNKEFVQANQRDKGWILEHY